MKRGACWCVLELGWARSRETDLVGHLIKWLVEPMKIVDHVERVPHDSLWIETKVCSAQSVMCSHAARSPCTVEKK